MTETIRAKIKIEVEIEFDMHPADYPGAADPAAMLKIDVDSAEDDPYMWMCRDNAEWKVTGELLNGPDSASQQ